MKKLLSIILCLAVLMSFFAVAASATDELIINVASDIHLNNAWEKAVPKRNSVSETFSHVADQGKLMSESKAVISAFLDKAASDKSEVVLITGDLADYGLEKEMTAVADMLAEFEKNTGKQVYVVPGNHDVSKSPVSLFVSVFADFGYNEAVARDTNSASYVAELPDGYRLLAIDSTLQGSGNWGINADITEWIRQQAEQAQTDGKKMIAMMHHNLVPHLVLIDVLHKGSVLGEATGLTDIFAKYGVKYVFTGHTHESDIATYTGANGEVVYDVVTGALSVYPCPYRTVSFGDSVKFEMNCVDKIDTDLVPSGMSDEAFALMAGDFTAYSKECFMLGMNMAVNGTVSSASYIKNALGLTADKNPEMCTLIDKVAPRLKEAINMPFDAEDESQEGKSIESILSYYGVKIPDSNYENMNELAVKVYAEHVEGDENLPLHSDEVVLATKGLGAVLTYTLSDVTAEEYADVIGYICDMVNFKLPEDLLIHTVDKIKRFEGIELVVTTAILPVLIKVTVDDAPADCNVTLPGYAEIIEPVSTPKTFWDKIGDFFLKIINFVMGLFAFVH